MSFCKIIIHISNAINFFFHFPWLSYAEAVHGDDFVLLRYAGAKETQSFIKDARTAFHVFWTVDKKHPLIPIGLEGPGTFLI